MTTANRDQLKISSSNIYFIRQINELFALFKRIEQIEQIVVSYQVESIQNILKFVSFNKNSLIKS